MSQPRPSIRRIPKKRPAGSGEPSAPSSSSSSSSSSSAAPAVTRSDERVALLDPNWRSHLSELLGVSIPSMLSFGTLHIILHFLWKRYYKNFDSLKPDSRINLAEKVPSAIHGLILGILSIKMVFFDKAYETDAIYTFPPLSKFVLGVAAGYEVYDMITMLFQKPSPVMYVHHLLVLTGSVLECLIQKASFLPVTFAITELTVPITNAIWYWKTLKPGSRVPHALVLIQLLSFIFLRLFTGPFTVWKLMHLNQVREFFRQHPVVVIACSTNVFLLSLMNIWWTTVLSKVYVSQYLLKRRRLPAKAN